MRSTWPGGWVSWASSTSSASPGDFSLTLLDHMLADGRQQWVGSPNELNAGYADGCARTRGMAALVTTFGVGELQRDRRRRHLRRERAARQITGAPPTAVARRGALVHHTRRRRLRAFARAYAEVTADGAVLTAAGAARIDEVLATAVRNAASLPGGAGRRRHRAGAAPAAPLPVGAADPQGRPVPRRRRRPAFAGARSAVLVAGHLVEAHRLGRRVRPAHRRGRVPGRHAHVRPRHRRPDAPQYAVSTAISGPSAPSSPWTRPMS
ncbi:hypothetical protein HBB16_00365 [Pseudonocardia sp. MCCB 268]|nr:hypothetical protein [Pseudonocardia cytotoxica]